MRILATDLDRTLLPNGSWQADPQAIPLFNRLVEETDVCLVYVTGRNLELTEQAISKYGIRYPDMLCSDVGTTIRHRVGDSWRRDHGWEQALQSKSPRWDAAGVAGALSVVPGLERQAAQHQSAFKQSYHLAHDGREALLNAIRQRLAACFDETVIYSFDSASGLGLLDILPRSATKRTALEYLAGQAGIALEDVVFCGDSGNDLDALTAHFSGVLVRNADAQLREGVRRELEHNPGLRAYFARGDFHGLNGNYTSGVIEGCVHYGLFGDLPAT